MSKRRYGQVLVVVLLVVMCSWSSLWAVPPAPRGDSAFWDSYWRGLMAMRDGDWPRASIAFTDASRRNAADGSAYLARGVVHAITEAFAAARTDLERARLLKSREPQLWSYALDAMTGASSQDRGTPIAQSLRKQGQPTAVFSGVPGHLIQGGDDYTTAYASAVIYQLAMPYHDARQNGQRADPASLNAARSTVGRWFANRMLATPEMASRTFDESKRLAAGGKLREARDLLDIARSGFSFDADMATVSGDIWLAAGRPVTARWDYTIALTMRTDLSAAYAGRAQAAAMTGDASRAAADLAQATRYGGGEPAGLRQRIDALLGRQRENAEPAALLAELDQAAAGGADVDDLLATAERLHRAMAGRRVRYNELYQDTIRQYEDEIRASSSALKPRVELAQYLHDESTLRGERVEPPRGLAPFRFQYTRQMELNRALHYVDQALAIKADHVPALVTKAYVLHAMERAAEAERLIDQAMELAGASHADAVRLLAMYRKRQIGNMLMTAMGLRTPTCSTSTHDENRSDGVYRVTTTTWYQPTDSDLARADALEQQARALMQQTRQLMEAAIAVTRDTLDGLLLESAYEDWFGSRNKALTLLEQAIKSYPQSLRAHDALIAYLRFVGQYDTAIRQEAVSWQLFQTTCAPLLELTWKNIQPQGWAAMVNDLQRARLLDPSDTRATAYLAIARRQTHDVGAAIGLLKVASALEHVRLNLDDQGVARTWPRRADDLANAMRINQDLALALRTTGHDDKALQYYVAAGDLALRYPPDGVSAPMYGAMRPDPRTPQIPAPRAINGATLASQAHLGAAEALKAAGRVAEAQPYFAAAAKNVRPHDSMTPNIGTGNDDNNFSGYAQGASAAALIELAKNDIAQKRYQDAMGKLQDATQANATREQRREINNLTMRILPHLNH